MAIPSSQPSGTGGENARVLADLALHDLVASFDLEFFGQIDLKAPASLIFPTAVRGLTEEGELEVVAILTWSRALFQ